MTKLLMFDLRSSVPYPEATPEMTELLLTARLNFGISEVSRWEPVHVAIIGNPESPPGLTDWMHAGTFRLVSKRFAEVLRSLNCECEFLPLIVHYHDKTLKDEYFALNALRVSDEAIDLEQSKIGYYDTEFHSAEDIEKLVLKPDALGDAPLCYLGEMSHYAVSDELAKAITAAGLIGIKLTDPAEFAS